MINSLLLENQSELKIEKLYRIQKRKRFTDIYIKTRNKDMPLLRVFYTVKTLFIRPIGPVAAMSTQISARDAGLYA